MALRRRRCKLRRHLLRSVELVGIDISAPEFRFEARLIAGADAESDTMDRLEAVSLFDEEN